MMVSRQALLLALAAMTLLGGCAKDKWQSQRPKVVHAGGQVLYKGQPLEGAHVTFASSVANVSAFGRTDAEGRFRLTTFEPNDGAVPGPQRISVSKVKLINPLDPALDRTTTTAKLPRTERRWLIPEHYGDVQTSTLTFDIPDAGKDDIVLELQGDPK
jgi:hypothetical protein